MHDSVALFAQRLDRFEQLLQSSNSATATLEEWMAQRDGQAHYALRARAVAGEPRPASPAQRTRLQLDPGMDVRYRHVELVYNELVLSTAENWYVPARLSMDMRDALDGGGLPFGRVIEELSPKREMLSSEKIWNTGSAVGPTPPPEHILRFRALVLARDGMPICEVDEVYMRTVVTFDA